MQMCFGYMNLAKESNKEKEEQQFEDWGLSKLTEERKECGSSFGVRRKERKKERKMNTRIS